MSEEDMILRDQFAMNAPDDCSAFASGWEYEEEAPVKPASELFSSPEFDEEAYMEAVEEWQAAHWTWTITKKQHELAAQRWAYADAMLSTRSTTLADPPA